MNVMYKKVAAKIRGVPGLFDKGIRTYLCTDDRNAVFRKMRDELLEDPDLAHLRDAWLLQDDLVVKRTWRTMRGKYCGLQLLLIEGEIVENELSLADQDFLDTLAFLGPFVHHRNGAVNRAAGGYRELVQALEDYLGDNPALIHQALAAVDARNRAARRERRAAQAPRAHGPRRARRAPVQGRGGVRGVRQPRARRDRVARLRAYAVYKKVAVKVHGVPLLYNKALVNYLSIEDRDAVFMRVRDELLEDADLAHLRHQWMNDDFVVQRQWRSIRAKYCRLQLKLIRGEIEEEDLCLADRDFLETLSFLEPMVQHRNGEVNIGPRGYPDLAEALAYQLADDPELLGQAQAHME